MKSFIQFLSESADLKSQLMALRPEFAKAAQQIYDEWNQDDDDDYGGGGICDAISSEIQGIIAGKIPDIEIVDGGQEGDDHAWTIVYNDHEAWGVDIPPNTYERGGGYNWEKISGVEFDAQDVTIFKVNRKDV